MYLSSRKTRVLSKVLLFLTELGQEHEIRTRIGSLLLDLLDADYYASYVWAHDKKRFGGRVAVNMSDSNLKSYEDYYQFHDPITPQLQIRRDPTLVTQIMPQQELKRTEFFNDFLHRDGLCWGVNLYAWTGDQNIGDMRIWRGKQRSNFDENDLQVLELIRPTFIASLQRARGTLGCSADASPKPSSRKKPVLTDSLSAREYQIVELAVKGLSDKEIAARLGICFTTVRTHIDSAFQKLHVNNRVKLGRIFTGRAD
jgi:DNA-binding CsgD family transcriptional regulator